MEKTFMSNREFKTARKFFKKKFQDQKLTSDILNSKEFKLFEAEENKRARAKAYTHNFAVTRTLDPKIRVVAFKYLQKYKKLDEKRVKLLQKIHKKNLVAENISFPVIQKLSRTLLSFRQFKEVKEEMINAYCFDGKIFYRGMKPTAAKPLSPEKEFKKVYKDAVLKLKRETSLFATAVKQVSKDVKNIKEKDKEFKQQLQKQNEITIAKNKQKQTAVEKEFSFNNRNIKQGHGAKILFLNGRNR